MPVYKVYHNQKFLDVPSFKWGIEVFPEKENLVLIAEVNCDNIDDAFRLTNHIDDLWWENIEVKVFKNSRSTSCGDVVEDPEGKFWVCAAVGWKETFWSNISRPPMD
jgi:hypothetical protein